MPADPADLIRLALATGGQGGAWRALELALADAQEAGLGAIAANPQLPPAGQLTLAMQAAARTLLALVMELADDQGGEAKGK